MNSATTSSPDSTPPAHILIVDDDPGIRSLLAEYLQKQGLAVSSACDGAAMWQSLAQHTPDLVVLDVNMPGEDGLSLCRTLRSRSNLPVIMLTARGEAIDRIIGLEMGADDYLAKPFEPRELLARIRTVLRRAQPVQGLAALAAVSGGVALAPAALSQAVTFAGWVLDIGVRHLQAPDGTVVMLSGAEFRLLKIFVEHAQQVLSRDQILNLTQGRDADPFDRSIDLQISRIRQKLRDDARAPQLLKTVRNEGYVLAASVTPHTPNSGVAR